MGNCVDVASKSDRQLHGQANKRCHLKIEHRSNIMLNDHAYCVKFPSLNIMSLNVCGLMNKLLCPDFLDFIQKYDIVCMSETKLDDIDVINVKIDDYEFFAKNRKSKRKSGGVGFFVRKHLIKKKLLSIIEADLHNMILFKLHHDLCGFSIIGCAIYVEPENSSYANSNIFECIENTLSKYVYDNEFLLMGDFNARSAALNEFVNSDKYNFDVYDDEARVAERIDNEDLLIEFGIPKHRYSMDTKTNNYGHKLVDMCKNIGLIIVNGRCGKDAHIGKLTCKDASLIDYVLASPRIITCIYDFDILPFNECLSDVHCPLHIILKSDKDSSLQNVPASVIDGNLIRPKWKDEFKSLFTENIDLDSIETIQLHINNLQQQEDINQYDVDETYTMITNVLHLSAIACGSVSPCRPKKKLSTRRRSNLWWNDDCENYRKEFNIARKLNIQHKTEQTNLMRKQASKRYKKLIKKNINNYHKDLNHKIRVLKSKNPKDFWKIINSDKDKESIVSKISSDMFAEHFESLNVLDDKDDSFDIPSLTSINNSPLNDLITNNEIDTCINKLKNNKACGYDRIINEFIMCSAISMSNLYKTFFNLVLTTGIVPEDWVIGIIKPIYKNKGSRLDTDNYRGITLLSCMGKLFTFILNERLKLFLEYNKILCEEQAGFRKGYSTSDHIFTLNFIIGLYLNKGKRLYGAFVDYRKVFLIYSTSFSEMQLQI
jgi:exonuclease III